MNRNQIVSTITATAFGLAGIGGMVATAASSSAATAVPAVTMAAHVAHQWKLSGPNRVTLIYQGHPYSYNVHFQTSQNRFHQELLRGNLRDTYEPRAITLPLSGSISGSSVVFSVRYPSTGVDAGHQGVRTFHGSIDRRGHVSGTWHESGSENGSGRFVLVFPAR